MQGRKNRAPRLRKPQSVREIWQEAERYGGRERLYPDNWNMPIEISDQIIGERSRAEDAGREAEAALLQVALEEQVVREARYALYAAAVELEEFWPGRGFQEAARLLREIRELLHGPAVRRLMPKEVRQAVFQRDHFQCVTCGEDARSLLAVDHITAVVLGGTDDLDNLQTLCQSCNSSKGARL